MEPIYICETEIKRTKTPQESENVVFLDKHIQSINPLFDNRESTCTKECCGIMAFDFSTKKILEFTEGNNRTEIVKSIDEAIDKLQEINIEFLGSNYLNQIFERTVFQKVLTNIKETIIVLTQTAHRSPSSP